MKDRSQPEPEPATLLVTIEEAAHRLSIGRSHIYEVMRRGRLRSLRIGRSRRIVERDLDAFIMELLDGPQDVGDRAPEVRRRPPIKSVPSRSGRR
jgi:excisionase family DNA binding protein